MKILVAGATGVVGRRLVPLLVQAGHDVTGTTRDRDSVPSLVAQRARPIVFDAFDAKAVHDAVAQERPDVVIHQLTDLSSEDFKANSRLRIEGTRNLVDAALAAGVGTMIAQSIAWLYVPGETPAVETDPLDPTAPGYAGVAALEETVGRMPRGVVLRYGLLYGPDTWYAPDGLTADRARAGTLRPPSAWTSFLHVDDAATAAVAALTWPAGIVNIVDNEPATTAEWLPVFSAAVGATTPELASTGTVSGRPISNAKARGLGWRPQVPSWRMGFGRVG